MADNDTTSSIAIHSAKFDAATLKLDGAHALCTALAILVSGDEEHQPSSDILHTAMYAGVGQLIQSARDDLVDGVGGAA
ncbi:hypothetical protein [Sulfuritalea hydrogenivorans]|uniref:hypothetical protein n=1 Tax=Sulfuritalea hydrogenivorans TaxID=748811 RepID=UPI000596C1D7|nr:hypothetical protein [Sulfuritalea hydrogenivorans]